MIDIHSHIVWGIDDGIQSEEEMKEAFQMAKDDGIEIICSTPHITGYQIDDEKLEYIKQQQRRARIISEKYGIQLAFGCELFLNADVYQLLEEDVFESLNQSRYILCEFDVRKDIHKISCLLKPYLRKCIQMLLNLHQYKSGFSQLRFFAVFPRTGSRRLI